MLLIKDDVNGRKATLQGERLISVPPASFPGASNEPLNPLGVTLAPPQSTMLQSVFTFFIIISPIICILRGMSSYFQYGEVMRDNTPP